MLSRKDVGGDWKDSRLALEFSFRCILLLYYINMKPGVESKALWNVPVIKGRVLGTLETVSLWVCMNYEHMLLGHTYYLSVPLNAPQILLWMQNRGTFKIFTTLCCKSKPQAICNGPFSYIIFQDYMKFIIKTHISLMWENGTAQDFISHIC